MCGIAAVILADPRGMACPDLFEGLGLLQHRGQVIQKKKKRDKENMFSFFYILKEYINIKTLFYSWFELNGFN